MQTIVLEEKAYEAADGRTFKDADTCFEYEEELLAALSEKVTIKDLLEACVDRGHMSGKVDLIRLLKYCNFIKKSENYEACAPNNESYTPPLLGRDIGRAIRSEIRRQPTNI